MRWWGWFIIGAVVFVAGLALGSSTAGGGGALAALTIATLRRQKREGLEFAEELDAKNAAEDMRRREADAEVKRDARAARAHSLEAGAPMTPPRSRHLEPADVDDWT